MSAQWLAESNTAVGVNGFHHHDHYLHHFLALVGYQSSAMFLFIVFLLIILYQIRTGSSFDYIPYMCYFGRVINYLFFIWKTEGGGYVSVLLLCWFDIGNFTNIHKSNL